MIPCVLAFVVGWCGYAVVVNVGPDVVVAVVVVGVVVVIVYDDDVDTCVVCDVAVCVGAVCVGVVVVDVFVFVIVRCVDVAVGVVVIAVDVVVGAAVVGCDGVGADDVLIVGDNGVVAGVAVVDCRVAIYSVVGVGVVRGIDVDIVVVVVFCCCR